MSMFAVLPPARAEQLRYNPATCSTDADGKVYLRLNSGVAFGLPADALKHLRGEIDFEPPPVAKPDDPEGCPGNPIITPAAYVLFQFPPPAGSVTGQFAPDIPLLLSIGGADARSFGEHGYLRLQHSNLELYRRKRERGNWCESTPAGWDVCYGSVERPEKPTDRGAFYVAREDVHPLRSGGPLTLECWPPDPTGERECSSVYEPLPRVKVMLRFDDDVIPVEQFFDLDRAITEWLQGARVPELDFEPPAHVLYQRGDLK
jgi:hypothetical protein